MAVARQAASGGLASEPGRDPVPANQLLIGRPRPHDRERFVLHEHLGINSLEL